MVTKINVDKDIRLAETLPAKFSTLSWLLNVTLIGVLLNFKEFKNGKTKCIEKSLRRLRKFWTSHQVSAYKNKAASRDF